MGSSPSQSYNQPDIPPPPASMQAPYGQTAPFNPSWPSFLPGDPHSMASGLTPEMLTAIAANVPHSQPLPQSPPGMVPAMAAAPAAGRDALAKTRMGIDDYRPKGGGEAGPSNRSYSGGLY